MIINCPECNLEISSHALACVGCGLPLRQDAEGPMFTIVNIYFILHLLLIIPIFYVIFDAFLGDANMFVAGGSFAFWLVALAASIYIRKSAIEKNGRPINYPRGVLENEK